MPRSSSIEPLESRIAPASLVNPLGDIVAGPASVIDGTTTPGVTVELGQMLDPFSLQPGHTLVKFTLNIDSDPVTAGVQPSVITIELFDNETPLTVANFLRYAIPTDSTTSANNDYAGTFLHRLFDFGAGSETGMDIVQGGGYLDTATTTHIPTYSTVHNEFSAARPNVRGTIAMAKTGLSPNTATSEWFINITNNTSILGANNNGGFTVFGEVIEGMNVIDQIAGLAKTNQGGVLTDLPVQNYNADPDNNAATPAPKPTLDQLLRVTNVEVIKPQAPNTAGQDFKVLSITDPLTGLPSDVVTTPLFDIAGSSLPLTYVAGKSGIADVKVQVIQNGEMVEDTFRVTVLPNLISSITADGLPTIVVPGDVVKPSIQLSNNGGAAFDGSMTVNFYLSPAINGDTDGRRRDADDLLIGSFTDSDFTLARDGTVTLSESFTVAPHFNKTDGAYRLIAEVVPASAASDELFTDDNAAPDGNGHGYLNQFGFVSLSGFGSRIAKLSYTEADGELVTFSITGAGTGRISQTLEPGSGTGTFINVTVAGTNAASIVNVTATDSDAAADRAQLHHIDIANTVGTVNFGQTIIDGYITISGGAKVLNFGDITGRDNTLILGSFGALNNTPATLNFGRVSDLNIASDQPIAAINAIDWRNLGGNENSIVTPALTKLNIKGDAIAGVAGDFAANVNVFLPTTVSSFSVKGTLDNSTVTTQGNVGTVSLGGMENSQFLVGANAQGEFTERRSIASFSVKTNVFNDSEVAAASIPVLSLKGVMEKAVLKITGDGVGHISRTGGLLDLAVTGTTAASTATFTTVARTTIHDIDVEDTIGTFSYTNSNVTGHIDFSGGAKVVKLGNITSTDQTLTLGDFGDSTTAATLTLGKVSDLNLEAAQPIAALTAVEWLDKNATGNHITAETLTKLTIKGVVSGTTTTGGNLNVDVNVTDSTSPLSSFVVKGLLQDATITSAANVGTVSLGGMVNSNFFVGTDARPAAVGDFDSDLTISNFTIAGVTGVSKVFVNSQVAAKTIAKIVVKGIDGASGTGEFGFVADSVSSYNRAGRTPLSNLTAPQEVDPMGNYSLTIL